MFLRSPRFSDSGGAGIGLCHTCTMPISSSMSQAAPSSLSLWRSVLLCALARLWVSSFFSFLFSYFGAMGVFFSFFFCFFWAARKYSNFLFCYFQFAGGGLCVLYRARGLASPGPHVGARPGVRVSRVFLVVPRLESHVSWGCLLVSLCPLDRLSHEVCTTLYAVFVGTVSSDLTCSVSVAVSLLRWLVLRLCVLVSRLGFCGSCRVSRVLVFVLFHFFGGSRCFLAWV